MSMNGFRKNGLPWAASERERQLGLAFGYPRCCVEAFMAGRFACTLTDEERVALRRGPGPTFVPCAEHTAQLLAGTTTRAALCGRSYNMPLVEARGIVKAAEAAAVQMSMSTTTDTMGGLVFAGLATELDFMSEAEAQAARELEAEFTADAKAGVDLRIRLIGVACS